MADKIRDIEAKLTEKYNEQVTKGENILTTDPALLNNLVEFKVLLRDMSLDLKMRKKDTGDKKMENDINVTKMNNKYNSLPKMNESEVHETKLKQLGDLEQGLVIDKQRTVMLVGMTFVMMFLQVGSFLFM
jgi:hypothetical protein